jgi:hypothetical protein
VSLTLVSRAPRSRVTIGGEFDRRGRRGFVLLAVSPSPALLTRGIARQIARSLVMFAERARPAQANRARSEAATEQHKTSNPRKGEKSGAGSREPGPKKGGPHHAASALAAASHTSRATGGRSKRVRPVT